VPAKNPRIVDGAPSRLCAWLIRNVASLSDTLGARLKDTVTDGNRLVWLTDSGVVLACASATACSGMLPLPDVLPRRVEVDVFQALRALPVLGSHLEHDVVLIHLRIDERYLRLTEGVVERRVQRLHRETELCRGQSVVGHELGETAILLVRADVLKAGRPLISRKRTGPHRDRSFGSSLWIVYWYIALLARPPIRMSCTACK
jgi:hypothetical protein